MPRTDAPLSPSNVRAGPLAACACPACSTARAVGARYCPQCGKELNPPDAQTEPTASPLSRTSAVLVPKSTTIDPPLLKSHQPEAYPTNGTEPQPCSCGRIPTVDSSFCSGCGRPLAPNSTSGLRLLYTVQGQATQEVLLGEEPIIIGSGGDCDVVLAGDSHVSRRHARITRDDSMILVEDLASSNGTLLRIRRSVAIEPGDELVIGTTVLRLEQRS